MSWRVLSTITLCVFVLLSILLSSESFLGSGSRVIVSAGSTHKAHPDLLSKLLDGRDHELHNENILAESCRNYETCSECLEDSSCGWCANEDRCQTKKDRKCNKSWYDEQCLSDDFWTQKRLLGTVLVFLGGCLCAGGGIGGGGIYIPTFILLLQMSAHEAVPLSKVTIFGVAVGGYIVNVFRRHPNADRPLIYYDVAALMEPTTLVGTIIGVYLNITFPAYLIVVFLVILLSFTAFKTLRKGFRLHKEETISTRELPIQDVSLRESTPGGEYEPLIEADQQLQIILEDESGIPYLKIIALSLSYMAFLFIIYLRGGSGAKSPLNVECSSIVYWALVVLASLPPLAFATALGFWLRRKHIQKVSLGYTFMKGDIQWELKNTLLFPALSILAGVAAGFLGIGGGMVKGPIMLELGVIPQVAVVTSAFMILFTSSATSIQFLLLGRLSWQNAVWYFGVGLLAAIIGNKGVGWMVKRYKKQSYVNFLLGFAIILSAVTMCILEIITIYKDTKNGSNMGFHSICAGTLS